LLQVIRKSEAGPKNPQADTEEKEKRPYTSTGERKELKSTTAKEKKKKCGPELPQSLTFRVHPDLAPRYAKGKGKIPEQRVKREHSHLEGE